MATQGLTCRDKICQSCLRCWGLAIRRPQRCHVPCVRSCPFRGPDTCSFSSDGRSNRARPGRGLRHGQNHGKELVAGRLPEGLGRTAEQKVQQEVQLAVGLQRGAQVVFGGVDDSVSANGVAKGRFSAVSMGTPGAGSCPGGRRHIGAGWPARGGLARTFAPKEFCPCWWMRRQIMSDHGLRSAFNLPRGLPYGEERGNPDEASPHSGHLS